jgi:hypothetical protein
MSRDDNNGDDDFTDPSERPYQTATGEVIESVHKNNPEKKTEVRELCRRLKILRETIAYKTDDRQYMEHMMLDLAYEETLPVEFSYYQHQSLENLYRHEERLVRDLATLGFDASRDNEREREELQSDEMNEPVQLDDDDDNDDEDDDDEDGLESLY